MGFAAFHDMKPFSQLMFSAFVILVCFLCFMFLSMIAAIPFYGIDSVMNLSGLNDMYNPESIRLLKFLQVMQSIGLFIIPPFILAKLFHGNPQTYLYLNNRTSSASAFFVIAMIFFALPLINFLGEWNNQMQFPEWLSGVENWMKEAEDRAEELTEAFLKVETASGLLFNLFMIALLPALGEELLFRGVIQRIFTRWTRNHHWGIWIAAILFSTLHLQFYGFLPRLLLGGLFGYLLVLSGSIWLPIIAHFFNNAFAVIALYLIDKQVLNPQVEEIGSSSGSYYATVFSLILVVIFMWLIKKDNQEKRLSYYSGEIE